MLVVIFVASQAPGRHSSALLLLPLSDCKTAVYIRSLLWTVTIAAAPDKLPCTSPPPTAMPETTATPQ